jgi:two-component system OmpR family sensor kinase/two-component system sensor histidine kinase QseC
MNSIRLRLLLALAALLAVAAAVMAAVTYRGVLAETEALFDYQLRQIALSLRDQGAIDPPQAEVLADSELEVVIQVWTIDGRAVWASRTPVALPGRAPPGFADQRVGAETWRSFSVVTRQRIIQVAQPLPVRQRLATAAALRSIAPLAWLAPLLALAGWWLAGATLRPLNRVAREVRARDADSLAPLPDAGLPEELAPLVQALNALLSRLGRSLSVQRDFIADAAHELRTPLTALRLQLQLLQRAGDDGARDAALAALAEGIARAARLVEQLLALARAEPGAPVAPRQPLSLADPVARAVALLGPLADERGSRIETEMGQTDIGESGISEARQRRAPAVLGDADELVALARNLIENALRHTPPGTRVRVQVVGEGDQAVLLVDDAGPGMTPAERERAFDRFWRRSSEDSPGSGLGLAIARGIAQRHGARLELLDSPLGGMRVRVAFRAG